MKKETINIRSLVEKYQSNCDRISEIADVCEKEQRERSEAENAEFSALTRDNQLLTMRMQAATAEHLRENPNAREDAVRVIRENARAGRKTEITLVRDLMMVSDVDAGGLVPLNIQDILKPLQEGFILDKVGLSLPTGLSGDFVWPTYEMVEASVLGEGVALSDTKIEFNKLQASPERIGIAIPVTNQSLNQSEGVLETIVREVMPLALRQLLNKIVFGLSKVTNATNLVGPFANIHAGTSGYTAELTFAGSVPTYDELNKSMKAAVLEKGIEGSRLCWIMTKSMAAILEGTPINSKGIYVPMIQNDRLCGLPVYTTGVMRDSGTEYIGLGDFSYQPMGLFGSLRFIVDPYSQARKDSVDFVLNADYATKTLRPEAFILGKQTVA